jgi:CRP-like cAMP-binding protein
LILRILEPGSVIGEREFAENICFDYYSRATNFAQIAIVSYEDFREVLREKSEETQKFSLIKDNLQFNQYYKNLGQICDFC